MALVASAFDPVEFGEATVVAKALQYSMSLQRSVESSYPHHHHCIWEKECEARGEDLVCLLPLPGGEL